jgi:hypothetical protein
MIYGTAIGEPVVNYLQAVGIHIKLRPLERAAFYGELAEKKLRFVVQNGSGAPGNARASRSTRSRAAATRTVPTPTSTGSSRSRPTR